VPRSPVSSRADRPFRGRVTYAGAGSQAERDANAPDIGIISENLQFWMDYASSTSTQHQAKDPNRPQWGSGGHGGDEIVDHARHSDDGGTLGGQVEKPWTSHGVMGEDGKGNPRGAGERVHDVRWDIDRGVS
jgi:hypothetical protein